MVRKLSCTEPSDEVVTNASSLPSTWGGARSLCQRHFLPAAPPGMAASPAALAQPIAAAIMATKGEFDALVPFCLAGEPRKPAPRPVGRRRGARCYRGDRRTAAAALAAGTGGSADRQPAASAEPDRPDRRKCAGSAAGIRAPALAGGQSLEIRLRRGQLEAPRRAVRHDGFHGQGRHLAGGRGRGRQTALA